MSDTKKRLIALAALGLFGIALIFFGFRGLLVDGFPAQYIGYFALAIVVGGLLGGNVWAGGPLDRRKDSEKRRDE